MEMSKWHTAGVLPDIGVTLGAGSRAMAPEATVIAVALVTIALAVLVMATKR